MTAAGSDAWADAPEIVSGVPSAPTPAGSMTGDMNNAWWKFTSTEAGRLMLDTAQSYGSTWKDTRLAVYTGADEASKVQVAFHDDVSGSVYTSALSMHTQAGVTYHIEVSCYESELPGLNYVLNPVFQAHGEGIELGLGTVVDVYPSSGGPWPQALYGDPASLWSDGEDSTYFYSERNLPVTGGSYAVAGRAVLQPIEAASEAVVDFGWLIRASVPAQSNTSVKVGMELWDVNLSRSVAYFGADGSGGATTVPMDGVVREYSGVIPISSYKDYNISVATLVSRINAGQIAVGFSTSASGPKGRWGSKVHEVKIFALGPEPPIPPLVAGPARARRAFW